MSCGKVHSQAREIVAQGYTATLVAATLAISRSSLYYQKQPRESLHLHWKYYIFTIMHLFRAFESFTYSLENNIKSWRYLSPGL